MIKLFGLERLGDVPDDARDFETRLPDRLVPAGPDIEDDGPVLEAISVLVKTRPHPHLPVLVNDWCKTLTGSCGSRKAQ